MLNFVVRQLVYSIILLMQEFSENLSTGQNKLYKKVNTNTRTYTQTVDKLWVNCDFSICCVRFFTKSCGKIKFELWTMWKTLLICCYNCVCNVNKIVGFFMRNLYIDQYICKYIRQIVIKAYYDGIMNYIFSS